jgi:hypothetical protein
MKEINLNKIFETKFNGESTPAELWDCQDEILEIMKIACNQTIDLCAENTEFEVDCQSFIIEKGERTRSLCSRKNF